MTDLNAQLTLMHRAAFGGLRIITRDEEAFLSETRESIRSRGRFFLWSIASGLWEVTPTGTNKLDAQLKDPWEFLLGLRQRMTDSQASITFLTTGLDTLLEREPVLRRATIEAVRVARARGHMLLLLGRAENTHPEISDEIGSLWHELPSREMTNQVLTGLATRYATPLADQEKTLDAAQGLTLSRASDAISLALVTAKNRQQPLDPGVVREFKELEIGKKSFLKIQTPRIGFNDLIGHDYLKTWLTERRAALSPAARAVGLPSPKGVLFVGPPGTGKSRFVEATAHEWGVPWLTLDAASLYGSLLGESEARLTEAIEIAERMSPCLLLIDEVERGFSSSAGDRDGGTQERVLGKMLTWMANKTAPVFVAMTSNFADRLPAALIRKGRLDEIFVLDFPSDEERLSILEHYLRRAAPHNLRDEDINALVRYTESWAPSELEACVLAARFTAFSQNRQVALHDLVAEVEKTVPVSRSMQNQVDHMRTWAGANARRTTYTNAIMHEGRRLQA